MNNFMPGDMARVIKDEFPENLGAIVEILYEDVYDSYPGERCWTCKPVWPMLCTEEWIGRTCIESQEVGFPDAWLRPIRPEADPVTTDCDVGVEA